MARPVGLGVVQGRHLRPGDARIGWPKDQRAARRHLVANNARVCILADPHQLPNLASPALALDSFHTQLDLRPVVSVNETAAAACNGGSLCPSYPGANGSGWRRQWAIEAICHQRLDVSLAEDRSRVRSVNAVALLGLLSRVSLALFQADCGRGQPVRDKTYPVWSGRLQRQPRPMLDRLLERWLPP